MSLETLELARRSFELWSRGDLDAWIETIDPAIGWDISTYPLPMFRTTVEGARRL
jgi:ketosteroid isomerase-like protein